MATILGYKRLARSTQAAIEQFADGDDLTAAVLTNEWIKLLKKGGVVNLAQTAQVFQGEHRKEVRKRYGRNVRVRKPAVTSPLAFLVRVDAGRPQYGDRIMPMANRRAARKVGRLAEKRFRQLTTQFNR